MRELRLFFTALQFLTRIPVPQRVGFDPDALNDSARHFSAVGLFVGAVAACVMWAAAFMLPMSVAVGLSMAATLALTGAFHEDGLADTFDGLGGAVSRERSLAIMKDSRIGSYGAVALLIVLGLKACALTAMPLALAITASLLVHTSSRAAAVFLIRVMRYAGDVEHAKARPLARRISALGTWGAVAWVALVALLLAAWVPRHAGWIVASLCASVAATAWMWRWLNRRLGGYTGDTLGATQQITELAGLLGWLAASRWLV
jgi:adenosylcobinamide-GDP ribazoletransferase